LQSLVRMSQPETERKQALCRRLLLFAAPFANLGAGLVLLIVAGWGCQRCMDAVDVLFLSMAFGGVIGVAGLVVWFAGGLMRGRNRVP
jgi:hypothetical protein